MAAEQRMGLLYGAVVALAAFGLVVVLSLVGNTLGGDVGRELLVAFAAVLGVGASLLFALQELGRRATAARPFGGISSSVARRQAWRGLVRTLSARARTARNVREWSG